MKPMNGRVKNDIYAIHFELIQLRKDMKSLKEEWMKKKVRKTELLKLQKRIEDRDKRIQANKKGK